MSMNICLSLESGEHESVNSAKTAGIVLGIIVPLLLLALVVFICYRNRKHAHEINAAEDYSGRRDIELSKKVIEPRIDEGQELTKGSPTSKKETSA